MADAAEDTDEKLRYLRDSLDDTSAELGKKLKAATDDTGATLQVNLVRVEGALGNAVATMDAKMVDVESQVRRSDAEMQRKAQEQDARLGGIETELRMRASAPPSKSEQEVHLRRSSGCTLQREARCSTCSWTSPSTRGRRDCQPRRRARAARHHRRAPTGLATSGWRARRRRFI